MQHQDHLVYEINALAKPCPMPLLLLKKALKNLNPSHFLLKASDPHSKIDVLRYCELNQLECQIEQISDQELHFFIRR